MPRPTNEMESDKTIFVRVVFGTGDALLRSVHNVNSFDNVADLIERLQAEAEPAIRQELGDSSLTDLPVRVITYNSIEEKTITAIHARMTDRPSLISNTYYAIKYTKEPRVTSVGLRGLLLYPLKWKVLSSTETESLIYHRIEQ